MPPYKVGIPKLDKNVDAVFVQVGTLIVVFVHLIFLVSFCSGTRERILGHIIYERRSLENHTRHIHQFS